VNIINLSVPAGVSSPVAECGAVMIGYVGEGGVTQVVLDFSAWAQAYGDGVVTLGVQRSGDPTWYPVALTVDGTTAAWLVSKLDTNVEGMGVARFAYTVGGAEKRSAVWQFFVDRGLQSPEGDAPDPYESWVERLEDLGAETLQNAQDAQEAADAAETANNAAAKSAETAGNEADRAEAARQAVEDLGVTAHEDQSGPSVAKIVNPETGAVTLDFGFKPAGVTEVNGKTGEVTLDAEDVGALPEDTTLDQIPDGSTYKRTTGTQVQQISTNAADIQTQGGEIDQLQTDVNAIEQKIPNQASSENQLADKAFVNSSINSAAAFFRGAFPTRAALFAVQWQTADPAAANYVSNNDYAYVADDETHNDEAWRYIYVFQPGGADNGWQPQFRVNESPLTAAQLAALNSGATAALIEQISTNAAAIALKQPAINASGILKGSGNGQVSAAVAGTDYLAPGALAPYRTAASQNVIDAAQDAAIAGKYTKPGTGIPENDFASDVQSKIDNALPKTGDGSNVTAAFTAAANRANISTGEKLSVIFGKIAKWFSDLGSAAFRAATGNIAQGSTDLVESGAVYNGLSGKYTKPAGGIPKTDFTQAVQISLGKADTALQAVPDAYRTAAAQDVIDTGKLNKPATAGTADQILGLDNQLNPTWQDRDRVVTVTGTTPTITALPGVRYICGEVTTLDITLPASGIVDVTFESGSTPTVLTITPPTGVTLKWANGFDPDNLDANTSYEINVKDGEFGVATVFGATKNNSATWEIINDVVVTDSTNRWTIKTDKNGDPFTLDAVNILIYVPAGFAIPINGYIICDKNGSEKLVSFRFNNFAHASLDSRHFLSLQLKKYGPVNALAFTNLNGGNSTYSAMVKWTMETFENDSIRGLILTDATIPVGTTVQIWGHRI